MVVQYELARNPRVLTNVISTGDTNSLLCTTQKCAPIVTPLPVMSTGSQCFPNQNWRRRVVLTSALQEREVLLAQENKHEMYNVKTIAFQP